MFKSIFSSDAPKYYPYLFWLIVFLSVAPYLFVQLGVNFSPYDKTYIVDGVPELPETLTLAVFYDMMQGGLIHTLVEWSSTAIAFLTAFLAFAHFNVKRDPVTPLIGVAMFWSGCMDAFHVLSATGLLHPILHLQYFIPISWTIARTFNGALLLLGVTYILLRKQTHAPFTFRSIILASLFFGMLAYLVIYGTATSSRLPFAVYPEHFVKMPLNIPALALFGLAAFVVFPKLHQLQRSPFSYALWLSSILFVASLFYATFFVEMIYDSWFNIAIALKLAGYITLFSGLLADYSRSCREEVRLTTKLKERDQRVRTLFEKTVIAVVIFDKSGRIKAWNPQAEKTFGWTEIEALGENIFELLPHPSSRKHIKRCFNKDYKNGNKSSTAIEELHLCHKNNEEIYVEYTLTPTREGNGLQFTAFLRDISVRKKMSLRMMQMDRLAAVGTLAAGVAHEINNPLTYVVANIHFAYKQTRDLLPQVKALPSDSSDTGEAQLLAGELHEVQKVLDSACEGVGRISAIINDLKFLSRFPPEEEREEVCVTRPMHVALRMTASEIKYRAQIVEEYEPVDLVMGNESRLGQVFVNLLLNAAQAIAPDHPEDNEIKVRIYQEHDDVCIEVSDTGSGIPSETLHHIFDPFFTTKPAGMGTGLGLSLSRQIVENHNGTLSVTSIVGQGTTFQVRLPAIASNSGGNSGKEADSNAH